MEGALKAFAQFVNMDLLRVAYQNIGILNYKNHRDSGEAFLLSDVLPRIITGSSPVFLDVGANVGQIAKGLRLEFPQARIWAIEPNPMTYVLLEEEMKDLHVTSMRVGLGSRMEGGELHCYRDDQTSGHATVYPDTFNLYKAYGVRDADRLTSFEFSTVTLDLLCEDLGIESIDFLKIDVEGHELEVLKGGEKLITARKIAAIQFEIADCHISSRVFLQDFYGRLPEYSLFRLNTKGLIPLGSYSARNEIFQFQNILALRADLVEKITDLVES
jgi:FkbM family methyltransferase